MKEKDELRAWFLALLEEAKAKAGSRVALARELETTAPTIAAWEETSWPSLEFFARLIAYLGGNVERCSPHYDFEADPQTIARRQEEAATLGGLAEAVERWNAFRATLPGSVREPRPGRAAKPSVAPPPSPSPQPKKKPGPKR